MSVLRHSRRDGILVGLAAAHGVVLCLLPAAPVIALGLWWSSNTVSHNFIHKPFFRPRWLNWTFQSYLTALLGVPQTLWRDRHLAHHAGERWTLDVGPALVAETMLVLSVWAAMLVLSPAFFVTVYAPGYAAGLALCWLHGHYEHSRGTRSHYGRLYNRLFFNDGYHVEHHAMPGLHWTKLAERRAASAPASRWPAVLRWLEAPFLEGLEAIALKWPRLQRFLLRRHEDAFRALLDGAAPPDRIAIVGGGLFPRTALVLQRLQPRARLTIIDANPSSIEKARAFLNGSVDYVNAWYDPAVHAGFDWVVVPLAYIGDRRAVYERPAAPRVLVHDWIWRRRGAGVVVSPFLLKRLNLVEA